LLFLLFNFCFSISAQNISSTLDSIYNSDIATEKKNLLYHKQIKKLEREANYIQLGYDTHEIAKWLFYQKGKKEEAIIVAQKAVNARKKATPYNPELLRKSLYNLGNFYRKTKNFNVAIKFYKELLGISGSDILIGRTYSQIGESYSGLNDPYRAVEYREQAFSFYNSMKDQKHIINNHINIVYDYKALRNQESSKKAIQHLMTADSLLNIMDKPVKNKKYLINFNLGALYQDSMLDHHKAFLYFNRALNEAVRLNNPIYIGKTYFSLGVTRINNDPSKAIVYFNQSLNYTENPNVKLNYWTLGKTYHNSKHYTKAQQYYLQALLYFFPNVEIADNWTPNEEQLSKVKNKVLLLEVLKSQIKNHNAYGNVSGAKNHYLKAKKIVKTCDQIIDLILNENLSKNTKLLWRAVTAEIYILGLESSLQLQDDDFAFFLMEKSKALLLLQDIYRGKTKIPKEILEKQLHFENKLASLQSKLSNQKYFSNTLVLPKITPLSDLKLNPDEVIIQFSVSSTVDGEVPKGYGLLITKDQKHLFRVNNIETLITNIYELRKLLQRPFTTTTTRLLNYIE